MSKVKGYIEDAVKATASEIKTKGVEISNCNIDNGVHIHNEDMAEALIELAKAQSVIANAIVQVSQRLPTVNQGAAVSLTGLSDKPMSFSEDDQ